MKLKTLFESLNLLIAFLLEIGLIFIASFWAYAQAKAPWSRILFPLIMAALVIGIWGYFLAPRSIHRLDNPLRATLKITLFMCASLTAYLVGWHRSAFGFGIVAVLNLLAAFAFGQDY